MIINYDLHWNPVRLIQRAGRVDRIGSDFPEVKLYNFFPEEGLESLLGLVQRLADRITQIDRSVGLDASVLGEAISERSLEQLRRLRSNDSQVLSELEQQAELISTEDMKFPLLSYIQQIGQGIVADIPMGIHSGKWFRARDARDGTFLAFRAGERHFWRFYPTDGSEPETHIRTIYPIIACTAEETRLESGEPPYALIERATRDILATLHGEHARAKARPPMPRIVQTLYNWINRPSLWDGDTTLDSELLARMNAVFMQVALRPFERDATLRRLMKDYEDTGNFAQLIAALDIFFTENSLYQESDSDATIAEAIKIEDIQLVCYEHLRAT